MTTARKKTRAWAPSALVIVVLLLALGTIRNQLAINSANSKLAMQAQNGQRALNRQCGLLGVSRKLYADMLARGVITARDYSLVFETAQHACSGVHP